MTGAAVAREAEPKVLPFARRADFEWTRSETLSLAKHCCAYCHGLGLVFGRRGGVNPCGCVTRAIFRLCLAEYRRARWYGDAWPVTFSRHSGYRRKAEEFAADFILIARRILADPLDWSIFRLHCLEGAQWSACCAKLDVPRHTLFYRIYAIEQRVGRVLRELRPYALYPIREYYCAWGDQRKSRRRPDPAVAAIAA